MSQAAEALAATAWRALCGADEVLGQLSFEGRGSLNSCFAVTDLAAAAIGVASLAVSELVTQQAGLRRLVTVDRRLASLWFRASLRPQGWKSSAGWDQIAGDYAARDGWIRLHTNAPHHRMAAQKVLGAHNDRAAMARAVAGWDKGALEQAVVDAGGCAAEMRSEAEWAVHPAGRSITKEALAHFELAAAGPPRRWQGTHVRPLQGLRVLDLTRVLAGPIATRFLAGYGAQVLRIDPPEWDEPGVVPEVTLGKRCARLDVKQPVGRARLEALLAGADVLVHGYRADALDRLGLGEARRHKIAPGLIDVRLNAYGWTGPWRERRGFDSLVQMSSGIAATSMDWRRAEAPTSLPAPALDHATGYLMAAAAVRGVALRLASGQGSTARVSLARTAHWLASGSAGLEEPLAPETQSDLGEAVESTIWGPARRLRAPALVEGAPMSWDLPASPLGSAPAEWV